MILQVFSNLNGVMSRDAGSHPDGPEHNQIKCAPAENCRQIGISDPPAQSDALELCASIYLF